MGKNKKNKKEKTKKQEIKNKKSKTIKQDSSATPSFKESLVFQVQEVIKKPEFSEKDLEFIRIASTQPLDLADFISKTNHGIKFKTFEQYDQFTALMNKYNRISTQLINDTEVRGKELYELTIKTMLDGDISPVERKILENKLPKQVER